MAEERSSIVVTLFSTASGVGKTFVAINIAAELARRGHAVCLVDLDLQFGDVCNYLRLIPNATISDVQHAMDHSLEHFRITDFLTIYKRNEVAFSILPPPQTIAESYTMRADTISNLIEQLNQFDFVIFDTAKIFSELNLSVLDYSTIVLFLCIADFVPAIKNLKMGYDTLGRFKYDENKIKLVQNRSDSQKLILTEDVEEVLARSFYHNLPNDFMTAKNSIDSGCPLVLNTNYTDLTGSLRELVDKFTGKAIEMEEAAEEEESGFFAKIKSFFGR